MSLLNLQRLALLGPQRVSIFNSVKTEFSFRIRNFSTAPVRFVKAKDSAMKFEVGKSGDQFLTKRKKKGILSMFAREQAGDTFSSTVGVLFIAGMFFISISPTVIIPGRLTDYYEHPETIKEKKDESIMKRRKQMMKYKHFINPEVDELFGKVLMDLGIKEKKRRFANLFHSDTFNPIWYGSLTTICGILMGIPHFIKYTKIDEVNPSELRHKPFFSFGSNALSVDEIVVTEDNKEDYQAFLETFILSENAKKFMIASKISLASSPVVCFFNLLFIPILFSAMSLMLTGFNEANEMFKRPFGLRLLVYFFGYSAVVLFVKPSKTSLEEDFIEYADKKLYKLGQDYLEGGIEYYSKAAARGKLFRQLHPRGSLYFDENGDPISFWFEPDVTNRSKIEARIEFALKCQKNQQELENSYTWRDTFLSM